MLLSKSLHSLFYNSNTERGDTGESFCLDIKTILWLLFGKPLKFSHAKGHTLIHLLPHLFFSINPLIQLVAILSYTCTQRRAKYMLFLSVSQGHSFISHIYSFNIPRLYKLYSCLFRIPSCSICQVLRTGSMPTKIR